MSLLDLPSEPLEATAGILLAVALSYGGMEHRKLSIDRLVSDHGWQYRKNKDFNDIVKAIYKALKPKYGRNKFEVEINFLALFLRTGVLKKKRVTHIE